MQCSLCNGKTRVLHTRKGDPDDNNIPVRLRKVIEGNYIYRKCSCECGNVFESIEMDADDYLRVQKVARQDVIGKVMDLLVRL